MDKIPENFVNQVLEGANWGSFGLNVKKEAPKVDESKKEEPKTEAPKVDESKKEDKKEATKVEEHTCPLCSSKLTEAISDEALLEHTAKILEAVDEAMVINESEEEEEELFEDGEDEDDDEDEDEDDDEDDEEDEDE